MRRLATRIYKFWHPYCAGGMTGIGYALLSVVLLLALSGQVSGTLPAAESVIGGQFEGMPYTPPDGAVHLSGVIWHVHSPYAWDSGVLGSPAVDDVDYGLGYGRSVPLRLPGPSRAHYTYIGSGWIPGSGGYLSVRAANGGHLAFFHLQHWTWTSVMHGGQVVGQTGWPTDPTYAGGGPAGPSDAHECVAYDALGRTWTEYTIYHLPKPKPAHPFHHRAWSQFRREHHLKPIAWRNHKGHVYYAAALWNSHNPKMLGGIVWVHRYNAKVPYTEYRFVHAKLITWNRRGYKPRWFKEPAK